MSQAPIHPERAVAPFRSPARVAVRRQPVVPNDVLGMLIFVVTEVMFFAGLISAYVIGEGAAPMGWPPPGSPRLPVWETALNTSALLASGVVLYVAGRAFAAKNRDRTRKLLLAAIALGSFFVFFQGLEWAALIHEGLTLTASTHGAFFYLLVGTHAAHAVVAIAVLGYSYRRLRRDELTASGFWTAQIFWYFVVAVWPILYYQVYL
jgi:heme/copper-type cytochrome/quinol oxidase subunit 3